MPTYMQFTSITRIQRRLAEPEEVEESSWEKLNRVIFLPRNYYMLSLIDGAHNQQLISRVPLCINQISYIVILLLSLFVFGAISTTTQV